MIFRLDEALEELDITRNKLAVYAEVRPNTVNDLANGDTKRIEIETLEKILKSLNEISMTRGMQRTYNIEDVFEYELSSEFINANKRKSIMSDAEFETIKNILSANTIHTSIKTLEVTDVCTFLLIFGDYLIKNGAQFGMKSDTGHLSNVNDILLRLWQHLNLYDLVVYNQAEVRFTQKGIEFIQRLKDL